jgi:Suppressor of fused protein (SUFU)
MPRHWYLKTRRRVLGPITSKQLIGLAAEGKLQPCHGVSSDGESWVKAKMIVGLTFATSASPRSDERRQTVEESNRSDRPDLRSKTTFRLWIKTSRGTAGPFTLNKAKRLIDDGRIRPNSPECIVSPPTVSLLKPETVEPENVEPECVESENVEPETVEPENVEPECVERENVEPECVESEYIEPETVEPECVESESVAPGSVVPESVLTEPVLVAPSLAPPPSPEPGPALLKRRWLKSHFQSSLTVHAEDENGIEILSFAPTATRPFATLMTNGLNAAVGQSGSRNELILYVPQDDTDLVALLRYVATMVNYAKRQTQNDIGSGTVIPNGNPASPIAPGSHLDHFLFLPPPLSVDANLSIPSFLSDQGDASVLWLHPITTAEKILRFSQGLASLVSRMHWAQTSCVLDLFREDVTESSVTANAWSNPAPVSGPSQAENSACGNG